jgi:hypothetical protein
VISLSLLIAKPIVGTKGKEKDVALSTLNSIPQESRGFIPFPKSESANMRKEISSKKMFGFQNPYLILKIGVS